LHSAEEESGGCGSECLHNAVEGKYAPGDESGDTEKECNRWIEGGKRDGPDGIGTGSDNGSDGDAVKAIANVFVGNGNIENNPHEDKSEKELGEEDFSGL
jgi:hypothetical protein